MNKGSSCLRAVVSPTATQEEIAKALGVSQQAVSRWAHGTSKPTYEKRLQLQKLYGIPTDSWLQEQCASKTGDAA